MTLTIGMWGNCDIISIIKDLLDHNFLLLSQKHPNLPSAELLNKKAGRTMSVARNPLILFINLSQIGSQQFTALVLFQTANCFFLNLTHTFTCKTKSIANLLQSHLLHTNTEEHLDNLLLPVGEG